VWNPESHHRESVDSSDPTYNENDSTEVEIPPTAVGGFFRSRLQQSWLETPESHQRELVDFSDPTYNENGSTEGKSHQRQLVDSFRSNLRSSTPRLESK
jgi:hypothetical protein